MAMSALGKWVSAFVCGVAVLFLAGCGGVTSGSSQPAPHNNTIALSVSLSGSGSGNVTSNPAGINCGKTCSANFNAGTSVTLTATPIAGNTFAGWSGACSGTASCRVMLNAATSVTASFAAPPQLTVVVQGTGSVSSNPQGINCPQTCSASFPSGTSVTLTAAAGSGNTFSGWSGPCSGNGTCNLTINSATSIAASFGSVQAVNHIIFMLQENRSFDHYFGQLSAYLKNNGYPQTVDGEPSNASNPSANGSGPVNAFHLKTQCVQNLSPFWNESHRDYNLNDPLSATATMDGFVQEAGRNAVANGYADVEGARAIGYYDWTDLPYYYFMAANFATSDRWFSPLMSRTQPNRMYLVGATSAGHVYPLQTTNTPPLPYQTIFDLLEKAGISWRVYVTDLDMSPLLQDSAANDFQSSHNYPQNFVPASQFTSDLANGTLPQVAMIDPGYIKGLDEHPTVLANVIGNGIQVGANFVSTLINQFMQSQYWKDSVFILSYDEAGGFYDHVPPVKTVSPDGIPPSDIGSADFCFGTGGPTCDFTYTGFRVPLIVISPFAKKNYVSHTPADHTAILKFIETRFNLPPLTKRDAAQMDMTEFFDFGNPPWQTPPSPPAQPTDSAPCYLDHLP